MKTSEYRHLAALFVIATAWCVVARATEPYAKPQPAQDCPPFGWSEGLGSYLKPDAPFPTNDTANLPTPDCNFHEWSWEAFVWATALVPGPNGTSIPRFMTLPTEDDLLTPSNDAGTVHPRTLKLGARSLMHATANAAPAEAAGAIVEADGNMLVSQNGYPVYASVHMNPSYFATAQKNLISNGGYTSQPADSTFEVGAAVFKATWLRLDPGQKPPKGAYTTQAEVPVLETVSIPGNVTIRPVPGKFVTVTVALVGLHVVGYTDNHPEFLWGTFEHVENSPETPDNTFSTSGSSPKHYTFYKAHTPYTNVNIAVTPPQLKLNAKTQKLTPITNVVLENQTGGENQPNGVGNILTLNTQAETFLKNLKTPQSAFGSYKLVGTVWMLPNSYNLSSNQTNAVGSVNLANATAETFVQQAKNTPMSQVLNCFLCHNPTSYSFQTPPPAKLPNRLIALSHVLSVGSDYAVPNEISGQVTAPKALDSTRVQSALKAAAEKKD